MYFAFQFTKIIVQISRSNDCNNSIVERSPQTLIKINKHSNTNYYSILWIEFTVNFRRFVKMTPTVML